MAESADTGKKLQQLFLQSVVIGKTKDGKDIEIPRDWITSCVYIEKGNLNGPLLKLEIHDATGTVTDEWAIKYGAIIRAEMGDPDGQESVFSTSFFVTSATLAGDVVTVIALSNETVPFKIKAVRTRMFNEEKPGVILSAFSGSLKRAMSDMKRNATYYLSAGQKPSRLLADMAKDKGALVWVARGVVNMKTYADLSQQKAAFRYEANNPAAERTISKMRVINQDNATADATRYRFAGYSMTDGYIEAGDPSLPVKYISDPDRQTLQNMAKTLVPKLDIEVAGNTDLTPGMVLDIRVYRYDEENDVSEAVPQLLVVKNVAHFEDRVGYTTRAILGEFI